VKYTVGAGGPFLNRAEKGGFLRRDTSNKEEKHEGGVTKGGIKDQEHGQLQVVQVVQISPRQKKVWPLKVRNPKGEAGTRDGTEKRENESALPKNSSGLRGIK